MLLRVIPDAPQHGVLHCWSGTRLAAIRPAMTSWVYILTSQPRGTLYVGITTDLAGRVWEHREGLTPGFTSRYGVKRLVWYQEYADIRDAIDEEKRIKRWRRAWKLKLIEGSNPQWRDLYEEIGH